MSGVGTLCAIAHYRAALFDMNYHLHLFFKKRTFQSLRSRLEKKAYTFVDLKLHGSISRRQIAENETYEIRLCCTNSTITEKIVQHNKIPQRGKCNIMRL